MYFIAVALFDLYFKKCRESRLYEIQNEDVHLIGITCMLIANKVCDSYFFDLNIYSVKIAHKSFSTKDIIDKEF